MERPSRQRQQERGTERESDEETLSCPECDSTEIVTDADQELVCEDCGLVLDERNIDRGPEWRAFNHSERQSKSRVGAPITETMHDKGLTTTIDWKDKDAYGRSLSSEKRSQMHRLRKWQERIRTKEGRGRTQSPVRALRSTGWPARWASRDRYAKSPPSFIDAR